MGEVYRAHDERLDRDVAVKVLPEEVAQDEARLARFEREAKLLASLSHQNIATLYGLEEVEIPVIPGDERGESQPVILRSEATKNLGGGALSDRQSPHPDPSLRGAGAPLAQDDSGVAAQDDIGGVGAVARETRTIRFLVMELAEGETLADRIKKGPIPVDDALPIALQIAEGLEAAHEQGIIHRDLKPANVMLSPEGKVKILDFGLAKAWQLEEGDPDLTHSPTLTAQMTAAGVLLGTAAYMSPEQARGRPVDRRTDVWAFGCCLWEMLTGRRIFTGETSTDILSSILTTEPQWTALPGTTSSKVREIIQRCLVKDPRERLRDIGDARILLTEAQLEPEPAAAPAATPGESTWIKWRYALAALFVGAGATALILIGLLPDGEIAPRPVRRYSINLPADSPLRTSPEDHPESVLALSPDGTWLVYVARTQSGLRLMRRRLDSLETEPIAGTEAIGYMPFGVPFFSPDGRWVGFAEWPHVKKVSIDGGRPENLSRATLWVSGSWHDDGSIIFSAWDPFGIHRVSEDGGESQLVTLPDRDAGEIVRSAPEPLPGGKAILLSAWRAMGVAGRSLAVLNLENREMSTLVGRVSFGRYASSGHIVYPKQGRLMAMPFDVETLAPTGEAVEVTEPGMGLRDRDPVEWAFSDDGTLVYAQVSTNRLRDRRLVWVDRDARETPTGIPAPSFNDWARLSPDGRRVASGRIDDESGEYDVWIHDLDTGGGTRITDMPGNDAIPLWTPDGGRLVFASARSGPQNLFIIDTDGAGTAKRLTESEHFQYPWSISPDGVVFYAEHHPESLGDLWAVSTNEEPPKAVSILRTRHDEEGPAISPDGRWIAYQSNESGSWQIWVRPYPEMDRKWPVSVDPGGYPWWHPEGNSIFFFDSAGRLIEVKVQTEPEFTTARPGVVLDHPWAGDPNYQLDISPDGERFLLMKVPPPDHITELIVVENWFEVLKQKAPPRK